MNIFLNNSEVEKSKQILGLVTVQSLEMNLVTNRFLKGNTFKPERIEAKNNLLLHLMQKNGLISPPKISIENACPHCDGIGFEVKFHIKESNCEVCNGTGWKIGQCRTCNGTGLFGDNPCPTCFNPRTKKGRGTYLYKKTTNQDGTVKYPGKKCLSCNGKGKTKKLLFINNSNIKEIIPCKKCGETGISKHIGTRVLDSFTAQKLKSKLRK